LFTRRGLQQGSRYVGVCELMDNRYGWLQK
jgi:hypothetical protein